MSFLTEMTFRRMATISRTAARSSNFTSTAPRAAFSTTVQLQKNPVDATKDGLKKVDRVVSDKLVDGIDIGGKQAGYKSACRSIMGNSRANKVNSRRQGQGQGRDLQGQRGRRQGQGTGAQGRREPGCWPS